MTHRGAVNRTLPHGCCLELLIFGSMPGQWIAIVVGLSCSFGRKVRAGGKDDRREHAAEGGDRSRGEERVVDAGDDAAWVRA